MSKKFDDVFKEALADKKTRNANRRKAVADFFWGAGGFLAVIVGVGGVLFGIYMFVMLLVHMDESSDRHFESDFKMFCSQLHGRAETDGQDFCFGPDKKILMQEDPNEDYNGNFENWCHKRKGHYEELERNTCTKDGKLIMRESKY